MSYPPVKESYQDRAASARDQYENRVNNDIPLMANRPQPTSGRFFMWYGWLDARTTKFPIFQPK